MPRRQSLVALALAVAALTSCGRSVEIAQPAEDPSCSAFLAALPDRVAEQAQRATTTEGTAAWGDPPITLRCGVGLPAAYTPTSELLDVNGVAWLSESTPSGARFTSVRTSPKIEINVPLAQDPASAVLVDLAATVSLLAQTGTAP